MRRHQLFFLLILSSIFVGCTTLDIYGPTSIVESPEVAQSPHAGASLFGRVEPQQFFHLVDGANERPLKVTNPPRLEGSRDFMGGVRDVVAPGLQLGLSASPSIVLFYHGLQFNGNLFARYQFLGKTYDKDSSAGFLAAIFAHLNYGHSKVSGDQKEEFGPGGYDWNANATFRGVNAGLSCGYRLSPWWLAFLGGAHEFYDVQGAVNQQQSKTGDYPEDHASFPRKGGGSTSLAFGLSYGRTTRLDLTYSYSMNRWSGFKEDQQFLMVGLDVGPGK
jgi:hypothetical protein